MPLTVQLAEHYEALIARLMADLKRRAAPAAGQEAEHRDAVIDGLHALAGFLVEHPDMPVPRYPVLTVNVTDASDEAERAEVDRRNGSAPAAPKACGPPTNWSP